MGLTGMLGLQVFALKPMAWLWCPGLVVLAVSEEQSPRWQHPRAGDVGMEWCRDREVWAERM